MMGRRRKGQPRSGFNRGFALPFTVAVVAVLEVGNVWWPPPWGPRLWPAWVDAVAAAALGMLAGVLYVRLRRTTRWKDRGALIEAAAARTRGTWLNRDAHQAFMVEARWWPWFRLWLVTRVSEDAARELDDAAGEQPLTGETFALIPGAHVIRHDWTMLVDADADTARELPGPGTLRRAWRLHRTAKTGFGLVAADPDQVAELVAQLRVSEPVGEPER